MGNCLERGQEDQHVVAGVGPRGHICHRGQNGGSRCHEVDVKSQGIKELHDGREFRGVDVHPDHCCDNAGNGERQEVGQSEKACAADQEGVQNKGKDKSRNDHEGDLEGRVDHDSSHARPEVGGSDDHSEVIEADELIFKFAAAIEATAACNLTEEGLVDCHANRNGKNQEEHDEEGGHKCPPGTRIVPLSNAPVLSLGLHLSITFDCSQNYWVI